MKTITVGNTVKIYRRCRKDVQWAFFFTEGNIVLKFLVEEVYLGTVSINYWGLKCFRIQYNYK